MGVDWYGCEVCGDTFSDAGDYGWCAKCGSRMCQYCTDKMIAEYGAVNEDENEEYYDEYGENASLNCYDCINQEIEKVDREIIKIVKKYFEKQSDEFTVDMFLDELKKTLKKYGAEE